AYYHYRSMRGVNPCYYCLPICKYCSKSSLSLKTARHCITIKMYLNKNISAAYWHSHKQWPYSIKLRYNGAWFLYKNNCRGGLRNATAKQLHLCTCGAYKYGHKDNSTRPSAGPYEQPVHHAGNQRRIERDEYSSVAWDEGQAAYHVREGQ